MKNITQAVHESAKILRDMITESKMTRNPDIAYINAIEVDEYEFGASDGICYSVGDIANKHSVEWGCLTWGDSEIDFMNAVDVRLKEIINMWPKHSGNSDYPVPAADGDHRNAYMNGAATDMWFEGEYATLRRELLAFIVDNSYDGSTDSTEE